MQSMRACTFSDLLLLPSDKRSEMSRKMFIGPLQFPFHPSLCRMCVLARAVVKCSKTSAQSKCVPQTRSHHGPFSHNVIRARKLWREGESMHRNADWLTRSIVPVGYPASDPPALAPTHVSSQRQSGPYTRAQHDTFSSLSSRHCK